MECGRSPKDPDRHHAGMMEVGTSLQQKCERICLLSRAPPTDTNLELNCLKDEKYFLVLTMNAKFDSVEFR
ncbi:putative calcium-transporting ATPase 13, plasma membrane-type [Dirofilaria immitis]